MSGPAPVFAGRLVLLGFGSVGQAVLPVLFRQLGLQASRVTVVKRTPDASGVARELGVRVVAQPLGRENFEHVLEPLLGEGDFLLNLSVDVSSLALVDFCRRRGAMYLDTCIEPWPGRYDDPSRPPQERTNYALREEMLAWRRAHPEGPTAVVTQGANPGIVSAFVKKALLDMAAACGLPAGKPDGAQGWAHLARQLGVRVIHIAEQDTQRGGRRRKAGEFVNTWSVDGFVSEGLQPSELGWGSHEKALPADGHRHAAGTGCAIWLDRPGIATRVRSWTPLGGPFQGFLVTHGESISIADHLTLRENGEVLYRPTVHYAYQPCEDAVLSLHELAGRNWKPQDGERILRDEIEEGRDELGVLLLGGPRGAYWYGSRMSIGEARKLAPRNSATSLQVVAGILGGIAWALRNPRRGVVEPDDLDHEVVLAAALPYLGEMAGVYGDWTPLKDRSPLFEEKKDETDPWQFVNFRVE